MNGLCTVGDVVIGRGHPLVVIAGPCVLESIDLCMEVGETVGSVCADLGLPFIFKASFDKANRSSMASKRGPGLKKGMKELAQLRDRLGVPVTTDIHDEKQAVAVGAVADIIQIPAFLCRQTDLLLAAAQTGKPVNVKKGQFLSPGEMTHVVEKLSQGGCEEMVLTERGTFFGYHRLVNDFVGLGDLMDLGQPVCFDATHSTQLPGATHTSGGRPERSPLLARAAVAAGVHAVFLECHPDPSVAYSDGANMLPLDNVAPLLRDLAAIRLALSTSDVGATPS